MPDTAYLGIDIAKRKFDVALARPDGTVRVKACPNTPAGDTELVAWVARQHAGACMRVSKPRARMATRWRRPWRTPATRSASSTRP